MRSSITMCVQLTALMNVTGMTDLLHAGASYLRIHQKGFGAVGVSTKYGKRAFARYPIFWGMKDVGGLPNPDPTDTGSWSGEQIKTEEISVDQELEDSKPREKRQAQNWAGFVLSRVTLFLFQIKPQRFLEFNVVSLKKVP